jgi:hypothetical protein
LIPISSRLYVQAAWHILDENTRCREFGGLEGIPGHFPKYMVTMGEGPLRQSFQGIRWMNLQDFLVMELWAVPAVVSGILGEWKAVGANGV